MKHVNSRYDMIHRHWKSLLAANLLIFLVAEISLRQLSPHLFAFDRELIQSISALDRNAKKIEVLFLGDSQTYHAIDPEVINKKGVFAQNFGFNNDPIPTIYWKLKHLLDSGRLSNLKIVFLQISHGLLRHDNLNFDYDYFRFYPWMEILTNENPTQSLRFLFNQLAVIRLGVNIIPRAVNGVSYPVSPYGHRLYPHSMSQATYNLHSIEAIIGSNPPTEKAIAIYNKIITMLDRRGIETVLYHLPNATTIIDRSPVAEQEFNQLERIRDAHWPDQTLILYGKRAIDCGLDCFSDPGHLNMKGAKTISRLIAEDVHTLLNQ